MSLYSLGMVHKAMYPTGPACVRLTSLFLWLQWDRAFTSYCANYTRSSAVIVIYILICILLLRPTRWHITLVPFLQSAKRILFLLLPFPLFHSQLNQSHFNQTKFINLFLYYSTNFLTHSRLFLSFLFFYHGT